MIFNDKNYTNDPVKSEALFNEIFDEMGWIPINQSKQLAYKQKLPIETKKFWNCSKSRLDHFVNQWAEWIAYLKEERKRI